MQEETFSKKALAQGACLFGRPETRFILDGNDHFQPDEISVVKRPPDQLPDGRRGNPTAGGRGAHPVPQVGAMIDVVDLIETTAPKQPFVLR